MRVIKLHLCLFCANTVCHKFCNAICVTVGFFSASDVCCSHFLLFVNYHWTSKTRQEKYVLVQDFGVARKSLFHHVKSSNNQTLCLYFFYRYQYHQSKSYQKTERMHFLKSREICFFFATNISLTILNKFTFNIQAKKCRIRCLGSLSGFT